MELINCSESENVRSFRLLDEKGNLLEYNEYEGFGIHIKTTEIHHIYQDGKVGKCSESWSYSNWADLERINNLIDGFTISNFSYLITAESYCKIFLLLEDSLGQNLEVCLKIAAMCISNIKLVNQEKEMQSFNKLLKSTVGRIKATRIENTISLADGLSTEELNVLIDKSKETIKKRYEQEHTKEPIKEFIESSIVHINKSVFKKSYKYKINNVTMIEVTKDRNNGFTVNIIKENLLIEIPSNKSIKQMVELIVEHS